MFAQPIRLVILRLLSKDGPWHFSSALARASQGALTQGEASAQLAHLESNGLATSVQESDAEYQSRLPGSIRHRKYRITEKGQQELKKFAPPVPSPTLRA